jgi:hypothetical protein
MRSNTTGGDNSALGINALYTNTTGSSNTAFGSSALFANTTASNNTALGYQALYNNTTASKNTAVGTYALFSHVNSDLNPQNTAVGYAAGYLATGYSNTFIGGSTGVSATTGINQTFVGYGAGADVTTGTRNTILGCYSGNAGGLDIRTASGYIVLSDGFGNPRGQFVDQGGAGKGWRFEGDIGSASFINCIETVQIRSNRASSKDWGIFITSDTTTNDASAIRFYSSTASAVVGSITYSGSLTVYNSTSDYRLKNITGPLTGTEAKEFVMALQPKQGSWKFDNSKFVGFIAHEFQAVSPSSVNGIKDAVDEEGKPVMQSMQASSAEVIANLVAHIQNLETRLAALEAK